MDYAAWSTYAYVLDNPIKYVDPDGMSHILYLVFQKGADVNANEVSLHVQKMLDDNGINLKVQVMFVGDEGFEGVRGKDFISLLDGTDALTFIGSEPFVEGLYGNEIGYGYNGYRVGYVNLDGAHNAIKEAGLESEYHARAAIHEGIGHEFAGFGHPDEVIGGTRYNKSKGGGGLQGADKQNIMTSGNSTKWNKNPYETGGSKFLPEDLRIINVKIPRQIPIKNPMTGRNYNTPKDNFSKKVKG